MKIKLAKPNSDETNTTKFVDIAGIRDELVLLKDGSLRAVIEVESVNFDLKANDEQMAIIRGFQDFLNAIDFPLQIAISSRKLDITGYLNMLSVVEQKQTNELLKMQASEYGKFIKGLSDLANIMEKRFFVVVPYYQIEVMKEASSGVGGKLKGLFASTKHAVALNKELVEKYKPQIEQRIALIIASLTPLGLQCKVLNQQELLSLYYGNYNPGKHLA